MVPSTVKLVKLEWEKGRSGTNMVLKVAMSLPEDLHELLCLDKELCVLDVKGRLVNSVMKIMVAKCELEGESSLALQVLTDDWRGSHFGTGEGVSTFFGK
uniref:Uncharacterized protein n=1 Tax=Asparagus officinalis TaxID=4686 RepID=Q2AA01_ASPOF|nr:hypothetical protein 20.t00029 [Asparagus officinalis]